MKENISKIFTALSFISGFNCIVLEFLKYEDLSLSFRALLPVFFFLMYFFSKYKKHKYFTFFLLFFALAELTYFLTSIDPFIYYYSSIVLYIFAYISLLLYIISGFELKKIFDSFSVHIIVLFGLAFLLVYKLDIILVNDMTDELPIVIRAVEATYNFLLAVIVGASFIRFLYYKSNTSILLFLICIVIVFSELIQIVFYSSTNSILSIICTLLLLFGFYFIYEYYMLNDSSNKTNDQF